MRKPSVWDGVALLSIVAVLIATWTVYDRLPAQVPTHFGIDGTPNAWMARPYGAFLLPTVSFALWVFMRLFALLLPKTEKQRLSTAIVPLIAALTTVFLATVHVVILYIALVPGGDVTRMILVLMGLFFTGLGLVMPRLRRNPIIGVRTPWTLTSDENWARTHRVAGYSMVIGGMLGGLLALTGGHLAFVASMACFVGSAIVPTVWSFLYARRADPQ